MNRDKNTYNKLFIRKAQQFLSLVKQTEKISKKEVDNSWEEVEKLLCADTSLQKKMRSRRYVLWVLSSTAAAIACILIYFNIYTGYQKSSDSLSASLLDNMATTECPDDIFLMTPQSHIRLKDQSTLSYDPDGSLTIPKEQIKDSAPGNDREERELNQIIVPKGKRSEVIFSDGTKAYINADSRVIYPKVFDKAKREIVVEGEVYLEVAPNPNAPFIVKLSGFEVKVLGTAFNISAYKESKEASVVLVRGKVEINTDKKEKVLLLPEQQACITSEKTTTQKVNVLKHISWKDNLMFLDSDKASEVLNRLSRFYGVIINYDIEITNIPISGKLDLRSDIEGVLQNIQESLSLECKGNRETGFYLSIGK